MFKCERCGSSYSALHAAALDHCPRCQIRDRTAVPLTLTTVPLGRSEEPPQDARTASQMRSPRLPA
jgi:predicted  nucleic acid-binding Zn-ribbon protein